MSANLAISGRDWRFPVGTVVGLLLAAPAVLSLFWTPLGATVTAPLAEPGASHWLGADGAGRDVLTSLMVATLNTLALAMVSALAAMLVGIPSGVALALGELPQPPEMPALGVVPASLAVGLVVSGLSAPENLTVILAVALPGMVVMAVAMARSLRPLWARDYVYSARLAGLGALSAAQRHVLPRLLPQVAAVALEMLALAVLVETTLSFAGLGVLPPGLSIGTMLREGQQFLAIRPLLVVVPGGVAVTLALALLLAANGLRGRRHGAR